MGVAMTTNQVKSLTTDKINSLKEVANTILKQPLGLRWIDLSFNEMTGLGEVTVLSPEEQIAMQFLHLTSIVSPH